MYDPFERVNWPLWKEDIIVLFVFRKGDESSLSVVRLLKTSQGLEQDEEPEVVVNAVESDFKVFNVRPETQVLLGSDADRGLEKVHTHQF